MDNTKNVNTTKENVDADLSRCNYSNNYYNDQNCLNSGSKNQKSKDETLVKKR